MIDTSQIGILIKLWISILNCSRGSVDIMRGRHKPTHGLLPAIITNRARKCTAKILQSHFGCSRELTGQDDLMFDYLPDSDCPAGWKV
jgi:hypothetical protein